MGFLLTAALTFILLAGYSPLSADKPLQIRRNKRSLFDLNDMIKQLTGRSGLDFVGYGNYCGFGGDGKPVDDIDRCCKMHDICYDFAQNDACDEDPNVVYKIKYGWQQKSFGVQCSFAQSKCMMVVCICDVRLAKCLKNYINEYNNSNKHETDLQELLEEVQQMSK